MMDFLRSMFGSSARQALRPDQFQGKFGTSNDVNPAMAPQMADPGTLTRPPVAADPERTARPSLTWGDRARIFATGLGDTGAAAKLRASILAGSKSEELMAKAKELGLTPREMFLLQVDPKIGGNLLKDRWSPYTLGQGAVRGQDGETVQYNPQTGIAGDTFYSQTPEEVTLQGRRPMSKEEEGQAAKRAADIDAEIERLKIARGQLGVSQGQLGVARSNASRGWAAHQARLRAGGYGTPGVGGVVADEDVEIDP